MAPNKYHDITEKVSHKHEQKIVVAKSENAERI